MTKILSHQIKEVVQLAPNAIHIENKDQLLKEEMNNFPYKFHFKFLENSNKKNYVLYKPEGMVLKYMKAYRGTEK